MKNIYCIVAPSGCGKSTIADILEEKYGMHQLESYTDRPPRFTGERGHIFLTTEEFSKLPPLCAKTFFNNHHYGVTADLIDAADTYLIDPAGVRYMKKKYHGKRGIKVVGLSASEETLSARMLSRGDTPEMVVSRLQNDKRMFRGYKNLCDIVLPEASVDDVVALLWHYIVLCEKQ